MDMFNKLKAKLAEEMDSESESVGGLGGAEAANAEPKSKAALEREVSELKEHINKNYYVYVKR